LTFFAISVHGLPAETPTWVRLYDVIETSNEIKTILVDRSVKGKWAIGAEIVITSHTRVWNEHQERKITNVAESSVPGMVELQLNLPIVRPTTVVESNLFAVEVALLSRNIVFQAEENSKPSQGGHFWVMHTPLVQQTIHGVEFKRFGRQSELGKYPIHFHFCGNS